MAVTIKSRIFALAAALSALGASGMAAAQDFSLNWNPRSGDVWVDTWLGDINRYGSRYQQSFIDEMVRYHGAPRDLVSDLLLQRNWPPGDIYYACAIAQILGRPCRYVVEEWQRSHGQGWGVVAQQLGIKPGSPEFHRLKRGFVATYDRWARPIVIDEDLYREFPRRASEAKAHQRKTPGHAKPPGHSDGGKSNGRGNSGKHKNQGNSGKGNGHGRGKD